MSAPRSIGVPADGRLDAGRDARYSARRYLWDHSAARAGKIINPGLRRCGRVMHSDVVTVKLSDVGGVRHAGFGGLVTCGSAWSCPVCSAKIAGRRAKEIAAALSAWTGRGGQVALLTLTMRHHAKRGGEYVALEDLWGGLVAAWGLVTAGSGWKALQKRYGVGMARVVKSGKHAGETVYAPRIRMIRVVEVTHGKHGWHPHLHVLMLLPGNLGAAGLEELGASVAARWADSLTELGFERPGESGTDVRPLTDAEVREGWYLTKGSRYSSTEALAAEVANGVLKKGRAGNRAPFAILDNIRALADAGRGGLRQARRDRALWRDWETASRGRRQIAWSAGLREELKVEVLPDQEAAELDAGGDVVATLEAGVWAEVRGRHQDFALLRSFEASTAEGLALLMVLSEAAGTIRPHRSPGGRRPDGYVTAMVGLLDL